VPASPLPAAGSTPPHAAYHLALSRLAHAAVRPADHPLALLSELPPATPTRCSVDNLNCYYTPCAVFPPAPNPLPPQPKHPLRNPGVLLAMPREQDMRLGVAELNSPHTLQRLSTSCLAELGQLPELKNCDSQSCRSVASQRLCF
jgi:hypothetical protein